MIRLPVAYANRIVVRHKDAPPGQAPPRRRLSAAQRRDLLLDAATRAFAEHGYEGASVGQIAEHAGVVPSVIYDHFGSKRALYLELLSEHARTLIEHTTRAHRSGSPQELFEANLDAFYRFVEAHPFVWRMIFRDPPADAEIAATHRDIQYGASAAITALIGSVRPDDPLIANVPREQANTMLAEGIKAVNNGLASWWYEHRDVPREHLLAVVRALLWTGLQRLADPPTTSPRAPEDPIPRSR